MFNFSVIIPTCNRNELLRRAVKSALEQRSVSLEIIVVDDNIEQDAPPNQLQEYIDQFKIIYVKSGGGKGGGYCRNLGLSHATKELVAFLDDDDQWKPDKLYKQALLMNSNDLVLCYTGLLICKPDGNSRYSFRKPEFSDHFKSIMKKNFVGTTSSVVVRRSFLEKTGGFDISLPALQDYDLYIRLLRKWNACWIAEPLTLYDDNYKLQKVSGSRECYLNAVQHLLNKYANEKHFPLLAKSLKNIQFLKMFRSRQFLLETIQELFNPGKYAKD